MHEVVLSPATRVSGLLSIEVFIEGRTVADARCRGEQFRGYEFIMGGRRADDAVYLTARICGICSTAHAYIASLALERAYRDEPPPEAQRLRQAMLGAEFLQNHLRHFYLLALPDYLRPADTPEAAGDFRFTPAQARDLARHRLGALEASRQAHEMLAVFAGKAPHPHGLVRGGVTVRPAADQQMQFLGLLGRVEAFIREALVPDTELLAAVYPDYFAIGRRPPFFLSYGLFDPALGGSFPPGVTAGEPGARPDPAKIAEDIAFSWFRQADGVEVPDAEKEAAYTWVKAPRYAGAAVEGGPVARRTFAGLRPPEPAGTMDRLLARSREAALIAGWMREWVEGLPPQAEYVRRNPGPPLPEGLGLTDAPRGALLHAFSLDGEIVRKYRIITPTTWNFSPMDAAGRHGPAEEALIGTELADPTDPVEIGRIIRAFDPCLSCGTHHILLNGGNKPVHLGSHHMPV